MLPLIGWFKALFIVSSPFLKMGAIWAAGQLGIAWLAWSTARFYSIHCAPPGITGFAQSLFTMGGPVCISAWASHTAFVAIYITAFIVTITYVVMKGWNTLSRDKTVLKLQEEIQILKRQTVGVTEDKHLHKTQKTDGSVPRRLHSPEREQAVKKVNAQ